MAKARIRQYVKNIPIRTFLANQEKYIVPKTQRNLCWKEESKANFITSILEDFPIAGFLIREVDDTYEIHDGRQRLNAISSFYNNEFSVNFKESYSRKVFYSELTRAEKTQIDSFALSFTYFQGDLEQAKQIFQNFNKGVKLTKAEIRNSDYGALSDFIRFLSSTHLIKDKIKNPKNRMSLNETILKILILVEGNFKFNDKSINKFISLHNTHVSDNFKLSSYKLLGKISDTLGTTMVNNDTALILACILLNREVLILEDLYKAELILMSNAQYLKIRGKKTKTLKDYTYLAEKISEYLK